MNFKLEKSTIADSPLISISGSKSETNRLLLLQALFPEISVLNISESDDSVAMANALSSKSETIDVGHAGTAMRFLTAYFAIQQNRTVILTGSKRMQQRPIGILVDALRELGADISYVNDNGFPPLRISGKDMSKSTVSLPANISSQYISALLLIAPKLQNGLQLTLDGEITSRPYIEMTLSLLNQIGITTDFVHNTIRVASDTRPLTASISVESDWSSASYFYSIVALSDIGTEIKLSSFKSNSFQGDSAVADIYTRFGVTTEFDGDVLIISKTTNAETSAVKLFLSETPDLAQTIAVTAFGLGIACELSGLHTLKIKETDRLLALKTELEKLGATVSITSDSIKIESNSIKPNVVINTYDDHRMAMAFAPIALKVPIVIADAQVVSKSYPRFWEDMERVGIRLNRS